jgi:3-hydroxyisobutyrate dehydrogenase
MSARVGFIGLGNMGAPMAANLVRRGHDVVVHDRDASRAAILESKGARSAGSPAAVADQCDVVFTMLPSSPQVEEVVDGPNGLAGRLREGMLWIDTSTIAPPTTRQIVARLRTKGIFAVDAPVSGGVPAASEGTLALFVGGDDQSVERAMPYLTAVGTKITHAGGAGCGQIVKLINNLVVGASLPLIMEALVLGVKSGVSADMLLKSLANGTAQSFCLEQWIGNYVMNERFEGMFSIKYMLKDLGLAMDTAREARSPLLFGALAQQLYEAARAAGNENKFWVAVAEVTEKLGGAQIRHAEPNRKQRQESATEQ